MRQTLVIEDDAGIRDLISDFLTRQGFSVQSFAHPDEALRAMEEEGPPEWVLLDLRLPGLSGMAVLEKLRARYPDLPVVIITAYADLESAIQALRLGAADYLRKPFELKELLMVWERIQKLRSLREENLRLRRSRLASRYVLTSRNPRMREILKEAERIAPVDVPVLILGESGTGKEVLARYIHSLSRRAEGPFLPVNVSALPADLVESELFGYKKGAFTGADRDKPGLFRQASQGTLFLDEIGDLPLPLQPKLLRVLESREVLPLGETRPVPVDVRVIAATNQNLEERIARGQFRQDLFYRLNVITLRLPPLRERLEDLPALVEHFLDLHSEQYGLPRKHLTEEAMAVLHSHTWPGNIRELAHVLARAVLLSEGEEIPAHLIRRALHQGHEPTPGLLPLREVERQHIFRVLEAVGGDKRKAARILGIDLSTLYRKLDRYRREGHGPLQNPESPNR